MKTVDGFKVLPWPELRAAVLSLPEIQTEIEMNQAEKVTGHKQFIATSISIIDNLPKPGPGLTEAQKRQRLSAKPYYDRLLKYYYLRTILIEA